MLNIHLCAVTVLNPNDQRKRSCLEMVNKDYGAPFPTMTIIPDMELSIIFLLLEKYLGFIQRILLFSNMRGRNYNSLIFRFLALLYFSLGINFTKDLIPKLDKP